MHQLQLTRRFAVFLQHIQVKKGHNIKVFLKHPFKKQIRRKNANDFDRVKIHLKWIQTIHKNGKTTQEGVKRLILLFETIIDERLPDKSVQ